MERTGILFYQNSQNSVRIFLKQEGNYDSGYTLEVGDEDDPDALFLPEFFVEEVPMSKEEVPSFIKEINKFNPLLLKIVKGEGGLIKALREIKYSKREISS